MMLWLKKLLKPRWVVSYDCEECCNHYCGQCGRGVAEANYCYTYKGAMKDAREWIDQAKSNDDEYEYNLVVTEIEGHTTVVWHWKHPKFGEGDCSVFASIDKRRYW
jgi:hypothetical protein